jgi:DNA-binding MarR family transcriptional regulator
MEEADGPPESRTTTAASEAAPDVGGAFGRIEALMRQLRTISGPLHPEAWTDVDLTIMQLKALVTLRFREPLTVGELARALDIQRTSASALVERLVRLGLFSRQDAEHDRRHVVLRVAPEGEALLGRMEEHSRRRIRAALARMSPRGVAALEIALQELVRGLQVPEAHQN